MDAENVSKIDEMKTLLLKSNSFQKTAQEKNEELNQWGSFKKYVCSKLPVFDPPPSLIHS